MYMLPFAAPNVENDTKIGITIRPALPKVAAPKGYKYDIIIMYVEIKLINNDSRGVAIKML